MAAAHTLLDSRISDSDEDLDLMEETVVSDVELKEYLKLNSEPKSSRMNISEASIYVVSTDEDDVDLAEIQLDLSHCDQEKNSEDSPSISNEPPDYESPTEDLFETERKKPANYNGRSEDLAYDELLEMCAQGSHDQHKHYIEVEEYCEYKPVKRKMKRSISERSIPYSPKRRAWSGEGKGKQPVSGMMKTKSSRSRTPSQDVSYSDKNMVVSDAPGPVSTGQSLDREDAKTVLVEEEKVVIPLPPPMLCEACTKEEGHNSVVQCCEGHIICTKCVEVSTKTEFSEEKKGFVKCPQPECPSSVPQSELRKALPSIVLDLLEESWKKQATEAIEKMNDIVRCPSCDFSAALDIDVKRFQCIQCKEEYCRLCERKWGDRPSHDLCIQTKKWTSTVTGNLVNIPAHWTESDYNTEGHVLKELIKASTEFRDVAAYMSEYMHVNVSKIYRIQNERLWEKYSLTKSHMMADLGELNINERRLFHGTNRDVIEAICKEGFDWRLCGKHGTAFGQGTYFARSPQLSHRYSSGSGTARNIGGFGFSFVPNVIFQSLGSSTPVYKPPLRFGAPTTTAGNSGSSSSTTTGQFTFGSASTAKPNSGFTFGAPLTTLPGASFAFGLATTNAQSSGSSSVGPPSSFGTTQSTHTDTGARLFSKPFHISVSSNALRGCTVGSHASSSPVANQFQFGLGSSITTGNPSGAQQQHTASSHTGSSADKDKIHKHYKMKIAFAQSKPTRPSSSIHRLKDERYGTDQIPRAPKRARDADVADSSGKEDKLKQRQHTSSSLLEQKGSRQPLYGNTLVQPVLSNSSATVGSCLQPTSNSSSGTTSSGNNGSSSNNNSGWGGGGNTSGGSGNVSDHPDLSNTGDYFMFLARVLLGRSCVGSSNMRRPERDRGGRETHSAIDMEHHPSIFVIFDNTQCYPEYLIQYTTT